jgi:hypothetical protein
MKLRMIWSVAALCGVFLLSLDAAAQVVAGTVERQLGSASRVTDADDLPLAERGWVFVGDTITTGANARLIIRFQDESSLTLGENARIVIDEMVYDAASGSGSQALNIGQGVFRYISGAVGARDRQRVAISTRVATIGIRGTNFLGGELTVGMPKGVPHYGFQIYEGAVEVTSPAGSVVLDEPGEGTFLPLTRVAAPTPVRQWTPEEAAEALAALAF